MYFGGSVVNKASTIGISPSSPNFHRVSEVRNLLRFQHHSILSRPRLKMQQDIRTLKQNCNAATIALCPCQVWWSLAHKPLRNICQLCPIPKIARRKRPKSSITQPWITRFRSNFVQSLNAWHSNCYKSSRSRGQRSRSQRDITYQHRKRNNSGMDKLLRVKLGENYPRAERNT